MDVTIWMNETMFTNIVPFEIITNLNSQEKNITNLQTNITNKKVNKCCDTHWAPVLHIAKELYLILSRMTYEKLLTGHSMEET